MDRFAKELLDSVSGKRAHFYAPGGITVGTAPFKKEWGMKALAKEIQESKEYFLIKIPPRLASFYIWKNGASNLFNLRRCFTYLEDQNSNAYSF